MLMDIIHDFIANSSDGTVIGVALLTLITFAYLAVK